MKKMNLLGIAIAIAMTLGLPVSALAKEIQLSVNGMVCGFCAQGIKKRLSEESAIDKVEVNLSKHLVTINTKKDQDVADEKLHDLLKSAGYEVTKIERKK